MRNTSVKKIQTGFVLILLFFLNIFSAPQFREQELRAMFLEAALRFITWPQNNSTKQRSTFIIGAFNDDKMVPYLVEILKDKSIYNRKVTFANLSDSLIDCDLMLLPQNSEKKLASLQQKLQEKTCLTVTDDPALLKKGIFMCIAVESQKIKLYFNDEILQNSDLKISHHLLKKSKILQIKRDKHE